MTKSNWLAAVVVALAFAVLLSPLLSSLSETGAADATPGIPATQVVINGTATTQFPAPAGVDDRRVATATATPPETTIVTLTDTVQPRAPYTPPASITLEQELGIPGDELAALTPELSEHRVYQKGEQPEVEVSEESQVLAQRYVAALNTIRERNGLPALQWDTDLAQRAEGHATTQLWYFLMDGGRQVSGPRAVAIDAYFGIGFTPRYAPIGASSHLMPTSILEGAQDQQALIESLTDQDGAALYGAAVLPVTRVGVGIALAHNGSAAIQHGWLTILTQ